MSFQGAITDMDAAKARAEDAKARRQLRIQHIQRLERELHVAVEFEATKIYVGRRALDAETGCSGGRGLGAIVASEVDLGVEPAPGEFTALRSLHLE